MRKKTKKKIRTSLITLVVIGALTLAYRGGLLDQVKGSVGEISKSASDVTSMLGKAGEDGVENLRKIYNEYISSSSSAVAESSSTLTKPAERIEGLEIPAYIKGHEVVRHTGYTLSWNEENLVADWVAYELTADELDHQEVSRSEDFRPDPAVRKSSELSDYRGSGYSRGHLAPAQDFKWSADAMSDTFFLTNMVPQKQDNYNAGIWLSAENAARDAARLTGSVYIVTGPVLTDGPYETIGANKVTVPKQCYKALLVIDEKTGKAQAIAMAIPQTAGKKEKISKYLMSVDELEELTGLDFFSSLDDETEMMVESSYNVNDWPKSFR